MPDVALAGTLPSLTGSFAVVPTASVALAGTLTRPTSVFTAVSQPAIALAGTLTRPTSVFTAVSQPAIALAGTLTGPTSSIRLLAPVHNQPIRIGSIVFSSLGGIGDVPIVVSKPSGLAIGDLMVIAMILHYPASANSDVRNANVMDENNPNLNAPPGWTFEGMSISYVDYTNYVGGGSALNSVRPNQAVAVFTKRITHADTDAAVTSYTFTRDPWVDPAGGFQDAWTHADVGLLVYRHGKFAGLTKDWIGYKFKTPPPNNIVDDTFATGPWRGGAPTGSTKVVTHDLAPIANNALLDKAFGVTIATPETGLTTNGTMAHTSGANVAERTALEGPSAAPPTISRTIPAGGSYVGAAVGFILEPIEPMVIAQVPLPTASLTGVAETTGHLNAAVPLPEVAVTGESTDPTPVGNVADYILSWDPAFFFKLDQAHASDATISFTDSSGYGRHAAGAYIPVAQLQGSQPGLLSSTYGQTAMRFSPTSQDIKLATYTLADQVDTGQISVVERVRPETNGPLVVREWGIVGYTQWGLHVVDGHLVARVLIANVMHEVVDPDPIVLNTAYTVGFKWDGDDLSLFRDGVKVATATPDTTVRLLSTVAFDDIYISSGYYTEENTPATHANLAIFNYGIPDSVFTNIHRLSVTDQAMAADPPVWGDQPPAAPVTDGYGLAVLADSPAYFFRLNESDTADLFRDSSGNGRDATRQPRINISHTPPDMGGPGLVPAAAGTSMALNAGATMNLATARGVAPTPTSAWSVELLLRRTTYVASTRTVAELQFGAYDKTLALGVKGVQVFGRAYTDALTVTGHSHADDVAPEGWETRYHYVVTCDGTTLKVYADGALVGTKDVSATTGSGATYFSTPPQSLGFLQSIDGYVDEVAIYPSALSASRVTAHWAETGLTNSGLAEMPVIPPPAMRGTLAEEDFEGGTVGDVILPANTIFEAAGLDTRFVSSGFVGQGLGAVANDAYLLWRDVFKNTPKLYYRTMVKIELGAIESGSELTRNFMNITEYLDDVYEEYYPFGIATAALQVVGEGGVVGVSTRSWADAEPIEVGITSTQYDMTLETSFTWFRYTASTSGVIVIDTEGSVADDPYLRIYTGAAEDALTLVAENDDGGAGAHASITSAVTAGVTYYVKLTTPWGNGAGMAGVTIRSGPAADNAPDPLAGSGGGTPTPITATIRAASTADATTWLTEDMAQVDPGVWYLVECEYIQDTELLTFRLSDETGALIYESVLEHKPIPMSHIGATGKGAPYGFHLIPALTPAGGSIVMDDAAVGDDTWLGMAGGSAEPVVVIGSQALEDDSALTGVAQVGFVTVIGSVTLEADEALAGAVLSDLLIQGQTAVETEIALPGSATGEAFVVGGVAEESDTFQPLGRAVEIGTVEVLELAVAGSYSQFALIGQIVTPGAEIAAVGVKRSALLNGVGVLSVATESMTIVPEMRLVILDPELHRAPTSITVMLAGGVPEETVEFYIDGTLVWTTETDSEGGLDATSISVTTTVGGAMGNHVVEARQIILSGILTGSDTYSLSRHPATVPSVMNSDAQAVLIPEALVGEVRRWVFQDLLAEEEGGLGSYILPMNPQEMSSPSHEKALSSKHTTAISGQFHISEAGNIPKDWTFKGYCPTEAMRLRMMEYRHLNRRFYVIDHRNRAWKVVAISANFAPRLRHIFNEQVIDGYDYEFTVTVVDQEWVTPA